MSYRRLEKGSDEEILFNAIKRSAEDRDFECPLVVTSYLTDLIMQSIHDLVILSDWNNLSSLYLKTLSMPEGERLYNTRLFCEKALITISIFRPKFARNGDALSYYYNLIEKGYQYLISSPFYEDSPNERRVFEFLGSNMRMVGSMLGGLSVLVYPEHREDILTVYDDYEKNRNPKALKTLLEADIIPVGELPSLKH